MLATIVIKDQVNIKIVGLEPEIRRKIVEACKYIVPHAFHLPSVKLGRWDGKVAMATIGGGTYINMLDKVLPLIIDAGYEIEIDDQRPTYDFAFPEITEDMFSHICWPPGHELAGESIILRGYQVKAIDGFLKNVQSITPMATGSGKTLCCAAISKLTEPYGRSLCIVPSKSLVIQTEEDYRNLQLDTGVWFGDRKEEGHQHTIATWQSLGVFDKNSKKYDAGANFTAFLDNTSCVIIDECFSGETKVLTPTGWNEIRNLQVGNTIINYSEETKAFKQDVIVKLYENLCPIEEEMLEVEFDNGTVIRVSANHKFLTNRGWVRVDELTENDFVINTISNYMKIIRKTVIAKPDKVYNLHVLNDHNYVAEGAVVSNCHGSDASVLRGLLTGPMANIPIRIGLTGTIPKEDYIRVSLECSIGKIQLENQVLTKELQEKKVLSDCEVKIIQLQEDKDKDDEFIDYNAENDFLVFDPIRLDWIANYCKKVVAENGNTLVIVERIETGKILAEAIGDNAIFINSKVKIKDRKREYDEFKNVDGKILIGTPGCVSTGISIVRLYNLITIELGKSFTRTIQSAGRLLRRGKDKDYGVIHDLCSSLKYSKRHLAKRKEFYKEAGFPISIEKIKYR